MMRLLRGLALAGLAVLGSACTSGAASQAPAIPGASPAPRVNPAPSAVRAPEVRAPLHALLVGGGPDKLHNQVAIESNVRYLGRLLPTSAQYRVRFADGDVESPTVQFRAANRVLAYRAPDLPRLDGAASPWGVRDELAAAATDARARPQADVLLYFTGHGSPDRRSQYANNWFDLWAQGRLTVTDLAGDLQAFPTSTPVTLVMVQCFSGAFSNVLFANGDPNGALIDQHLAGFFAAVPDRVAAGCTPAVEEDEYRDFTGYFFAALTGQDRMGRPVSGADYDGDGRVGLNEAFAWTLIHDDSIDTPVCTSDAFLRRFVAMPDGAIAERSIKELTSWAGPAQRAALVDLAAALHLTSEDLLGAALARLIRIRPNSAARDDVRLIRFVNLARSVALAHTLALSSDEMTKRRYAQLLGAESRNPLR